MALVAASTGRIVGATLGNDVNLRDFEGRSALLLGKAKDNNASASLGPFMRLFDDGFTLDDVRRRRDPADRRGPGGLSRSKAPAPWARSAAIRPTWWLRPSASNHQYPDGFVLYLGTMFAPVEDRDVAGQGFTHKVGDIVTIASPKLGRLSNVVVHCSDAEPWTFGAAALMRNLARRRLI